MKGKVSFPFYYNWEQQLLRMDLEERWNFVHNLIKFHTGREISFISEKEEMAWIGIETALLINLEKYELQVQRSRENGKKSNGRPRKEETQEVFSKPKKPDNGKKEIVNGKEITDNRKLAVDNRKRDLDHRNTETNTEKSEFSLFYKLNSIDGWENKLLTNGSGFMIDELNRSFQLSRGEMNSLVRLYTYMNSQRDSEGTER